MPQLPPLLDAILAAFIDAAERHADVFLRLRLLTCR